MTWLSTSETLRWRTAPDFNLQAIRGFDLSLSSFWYRSNMVLVFCNPESVSQLVSFCNRLAVINGAIQDEAGKLAVLLHEGRSGQSNLSWLKELPFPVLLDRESHVLERYRTFLPEITEAVLMIFVLDRYGAVFAAYSNPHLNDPLPGSEITDWLKFIELQCPE